MSAEVDVERRIKRGRADIETSARRRRNVRPCLSIKPIILLYTHRTQPTLKLYV